MTTTPINNGGPAFPVPDTYHASGQVEYGPTGMSLRDWFAGQAMAGLLANPDWTHNNISKPDNGTSIPELAWEVADAMLAERAKGGAQ